MPHRLRTLLSVDDLVVDLIKELGTQGVLVLSRASLSSRHEPWAHDSFFLIISVGTEFIYKEKRIMSPGILSCIVVRMIVTVLM